MDDTDIRGLSAQDAQAYAIEFLTALKALERELGALGDELATWARRVELAAAKGAAGLEAAARAKVDELSAKKSALESERTDLAAKVARLRENLPMAGSQERSIDADLLLAQLRMAAGQEPDDRDDSGSPRLESDLAALGADDALAALKRKINDTGKEQ